MGESGEDGRVEEEEKGGEEEGEEGEEDKGQQLFDHVNVRCRAEIVDSSGRDGFAKSLCPCS